MAVDRSLYKNQKNMQRLVVRNFGPVASVEVEVSSLMVLIGAQASGKSTVSKGIFFFKSLRDDVLRYLLESIDSADYAKPLGQIGTYEKIDKEKIGIAKRLINSILKAKYLNDGEGEKLFVDEGIYTKINYASSGQQESIWILNLIFLAILNSQTVFVVFEEPEAHLYPSAQKEIVELISLLLNSGDNQIVITTHSPYVLSAFNNLLFASRAAKSNRESVGKIVPSSLWLSVADASVFKLQSGHLASIVDQEEELIDIGEIDDVSEAINETFDQLLNLN